MSPQEHLCFVNSGPHVSKELWREFYTTEHLPDVYNSGCATKAVFYEEIPVSPDAKVDGPRNFLALYPTPHRDLMKSENHYKIRVKSELFAKENSDTDLVSKNADWNVRNYDLIQDFDPLKTGEQAPPHIVTVEIHPNDVEDLDKWYREEHLDLLKEIPGYRRSLRYKLGQDSGLMNSDFQPDYLAIHEVDDISAFGGEEATAASTTAWTQKQIADSKVFAVRGWKLLHSLGF